MNSIIYFEIQSSNPKRDTQFYQNVFGWHFEHVDGLPIEYYRIETEGIHGGLLQRPAAIPSTECGTNAFTCTIGLLKVAPSLISCMSFLYQAPLGG